MVLKICISGLTATGKTTVGAKVAEALKIRHLNPTYKDFVKDTEGLLELMQHVDKKFAQKFDDALIEEAKKQDCVTSNWLAPWLIKDATLRVLLVASAEARAKRWAGEHAISEKEAKRIITEKDEANRRHFTDAYRINIDDHTIFDLTLNTEKMAMDEMIATISMLSLERSKKDF
jgi:cytidylate kinase